MKLQVLGAAGTVAGSHYLLEHEGRRVLHHLKSSASRAGWPKPRPMAIRWTCRHERPKAG